MTIPTPERELTIPQIDGMSHVVLAWTSETLTAHMARIVQYSGHTYLVARDGTALVVTWRVGNWWTVDMIV